MNKIPLFSLLLVLNHVAAAQSPLPDSCKIEIGTNLSGMFDWSTEMPFANLMRHCPKRSFYPDELNFDRTISGTWFMI